jgi:hypothetical protein
MLERRIPRRAVYGLPKRLIRFIRSTMGMIVWAPLQRISFDTVGLLGVFIGDVPKVVFSDGKRPPKIEQSDFEQFCRVIGSY